SKLETHLELTKTTSSQVGERRQELEAETETEEEDPQRALAIQEVDQQSQFLEQAEIFTEVLRAQVHAQVTGQEIGDVVTEEGSSALVGLPKSVVGKINQRIGNVTTRGKSSAAVGVFPDGVDMCGWRSRS
ncbi:hypothetical protein LTR17_024044, partial [Elasticomyces elasticus]